MSREITEEFQPDTRRTRRGSDTSRPSSPLASAAAWCPFEPFEDLDHVVVLGEAHLRRLPQSYARYYNATRTHRSLDKGAPFSRPVQRIERILSHSLIGGLHHQYVRVWVFGVERVRSASTAERTSWSLNTLHEQTIMARWFWFGP